MLAVSLKDSFIVWLLGAIHKVRTQVGRRGGGESWQKCTGAYMGSGGREGQTWGVRMQFEFVFFIFQDFLDKKGEWKQLR